MARIEIASQYVDSTVSGTAVTTVTSSSSHIDNGITFTGGSSRNSDVTVLKATNAATSATNIVVKAGDTNFSRAKIGDLTWSVAASATENLVLERGRHYQSDGTIDIDVATTTISIACVNYKATR